MLFQTAWLLVFSNIYFLRRIKIVILYSVSNSNLSSLYGSDAAGSCL